MEKRESVSNLILENGMIVQVDASGRIFKQAEEAQSGRNAEDVALLVAWHKEQNKGQAVALAQLAKMTKTEEELTLA